MCSVREQVMKVICASDEGGFNFSVKARKKERLRFFQVDF